MIEILKIFIALPIFLLLIFVPINVFKDKKKLFLNASEIDILSFNLILNCSLLLVLSFLPIKISTYQPLYLVIYFLIFFYNYILKINTNKKKIINIFKELFFLSIIFYFFSIVVASKLNLGWDAKYFYYIKSLFFIDGLFFSDLKNFKDNVWHPHFGSFIWAFFWNFSFFNLEYFGRLFYVFLYCFSIFYLCYSIKQNQFIKNIIFILISVMVFSYERFSGLQEILIFSFLIISSQYFFKQKKNFIFTLFIILICNLIIWIKSEGIIYTSILFAILLLNKSTPLKIKSYIMAVFIFIISSKILIYNYFDFNSNAQPYVAFTLAYNFEYFLTINFQIILYKLKYIILYFGYYTLKNPFFILGLIILLYLNIKNLKNINLYNFNIYFILSTCFIVSAYIFRDLEIEYSLKTTMERIIFTSSAFYAFLVINFFSQYLKNKKILK